MKKITSYLLVAVMLLALIPFSAFSVSADVDLWDGTAKPFEEGSGTEDDPYLITSAEELAYFAQTVNSGYSYSGEYIKLTTNIKLNDEIFTINRDTALVKVTDGTNTAYLGTGVKGNDVIGDNTVFDSTASERGKWYASENSTDEGNYSGTIKTWAGIGNSSYTFSGNFDGGNHYVSGIYIVSNTGSKGLFGYASGATIKNVAVINSCMIQMSSVGDLGGIAGYLTRGTIENCYCENSVLINYIGNSNSASAGGIVGEIGNTTTIKNCYSSAYLRYQTCGGIVGYVYGDSYSYASTRNYIINCFNNGNISGSYAGGIAGYLNYGYLSVIDCYNIGEVIGSSRAGGIVGVNNSNQTITFTTCYYKMGSATYGSTIAQGLGGYDDKTGGCKSLTVSALKKQESYSGFDFENVWQMNSESDYIYPTLRGLPFVDLNTCAHEFESVITQPTCSNAGYTTHTCIKCSYSYTDSNVSATGHAYEDSVTAPTCTEQGYTTHTCSTCGDSYVDSYVSSNGHKTNAVTDCNTAKVCSVCGTTVESAKGHNYVDKVTAPTCTAQGYTTHTCSACGDSYTDSYVRSNGHAAGEKADCTHDQICTSCGETLVEALGHTEGEWKIVVEATVGEKGLMEQYCADCGTILDSKEIPALDGDSVIYSLGDVNADKKVDSVDYLLVKRACFKTYTLSEEEAVRADVNVDKKVDSTDYLLIKRIAFGTYKINQLTYTMN